MSKTLLAMGAHCDDCIVGIPGILIKAIRKGYRVVILAMIGDYNNWPPWAPIKDRQKEFIENTILICNEYGAEIRYLDFKSHHFEVNLSRKLAVAEVVAEVQPDIAFLPWRPDQNDDHTVASQLGEIALRYAGPLLERQIPKREPRLMFAYDNGPHHTIGFEPDTYVDVTSEWATAMEWLGQMIALIRNKPFDSKFQDRALEIKEALGAYRGIACGVRFAEAVRSLKPYPNEIL